MTINLARAGIQHHLYHSSQPVPSHFSFLEEREKMAWQTVTKSKPKKQWGLTRMKSKQAAVTKPKSKAGEVKVTQW